ncbi:acyltransferase [Rhodococcus pyridinivorans]|uniref:acyltransferase n=1 Tax=Rhodococcus pyridinivorans TaxID=103816 RepID=UPI001E46C3C2|nr:acyltransferase [Rhodococcus pyridinivorans]MCD5419780.1 acyltransferase [Rhodococcus pyridinivorans]
MRLRTVALAPALLLLAACGDSGTTAEPTPTTSAPATQAEDTAGLNARGAVEVQLGETATVVQNGTTVLEVSDTSLSTDGCDINTTSDAITKQGFSATVQVGPSTITQWLWASDFYYVDADGKITKNVDTSDAEPCSGPGSNAFIDLPPNSSADGRVTLDIPNETEVIGYSTTQGGQNIRVEWVLPETAGEAVAEAPPAEQAPAVEPTATLEQTQPAAPQPEAATAPPVGYTGAPNGAPQPLVGKTIDYCMDGDMYQPGTTQFTDGTTGWTQECAGQ